MSHRIRKALLCGLSWISGLAFWIPDVFVHAIRGHRFGGSAFDILGVTLLSAASACLIVMFVADRMKEQLSRRAVILWMLLGIWMLGPLCMVINGSFAGGDVGGTGDGIVILVSTVIFPLSTWMMGAYDGTLLSLIAVTGIFLIAGLSCRKTEQADSSDSEHRS